MTRPSPALIAEWYGKLRRAGFRDIEGGRDLNKLHTWTFRGGDGTHGAAVESLPEGFEPRCTLADHPTAIYYRELARAAEQAKTDDLAVMLSLATLDGNTAHAARVLGMRRNWAGKQERRFAKSIGLLREAHGS